MGNFVGIDLGTTNSAICSYDASEIRIWKSAEQNDVTPSAIYIGRRGNKYIGQRAYDAAPRSPDNCATLFKRFMGTSTPIELSAVNLTLTPEECSAELLKVLYGYLPEEIRNDLDIGTVITVPAAFNQMQKDATMQAAEMAGIGEVALMQEPVAAVMSVMKARNTDGIFLIYDLGGGTLDIAIAESIDRRVNLLAHGGIQMCGGRDFDRLLVDNVVRPWLRENFNLPEDLSVNPTFKPLIRLATWATERAKIELSAREDTVIRLEETDAQTEDLNGNEIYLDIPLNRDAYEGLIVERINETVNCARETLSETGFTPNDLDCIVWVGGPTNYKPLRDKVSFELGIRGNMDVNPMTAVAEGASLFAESIDWNSTDRRRKPGIGQISSEAISFKYEARTPDVRAKIAVQMAEQVPSSYEFQIDSTDTGWTSGRLSLKDGATVDVTLTMPGENTFKVLVYDAMGRPITLEPDGIVITQTVATVDGIPASHTVSIAALDRPGGRPEHVNLVKSGEPLPKEGRLMFKAAESLEAGSSEAGSSRSLKFHLWQGDIQYPIDANLHIGAMEIKDTDFADGFIPVGADIECDYAVLDSGEIRLEVSVPCISGTFKYRNYYSREEGQLDYASDAVRTQVDEERENAIEHINEIIEVVDDPEELEREKQKLESRALLGSEEMDAETVLETSQKIRQVNEIVDRFRSEHLQKIRQNELNKVVSFFNEYIRQHARSSEAEAFDNLAREAQDSIDRSDSDFEGYLDELKGKNFEILWRQDWFVIEQFKQMERSPHLFTDEDRFKELATIGAELIPKKDDQMPRSVIRSDDIEKLRSVVVEMSMLQIDGRLKYDEKILVNIIKG